MDRSSAPAAAGLAVAKRAAEFVLWTRVGVQRRVEAAFYRDGSRPWPTPTAPTRVLQSSAEWKAAVREMRRLRLPLHHDRPKNWDTLGAVSTVLHSVGTDARVLDAGSARYSTVLPCLRLYGLTALMGNNLEFGREVRRGAVRFRYGDVTGTDFPDGSFDAITCLSVIEHGVPVVPFLTESARLLRPGGALVVSTDYDADPPDTTGKTAYGVPVHIFSPPEIKALVNDAEGVGLRLRGDFLPEHPERPAYWKRMRLGYTYVQVTFDRI